MTTQKEKEWDDIWMTLAKNIADKKSKDLRLQVGCVIITQDNENVLSLGYNGDEKRWDKQTR